jgi:hypothetical protein
MTAKEISESEYKDLCKQRSKLEIELAKEMLRVFEGAAFLSQIRECVKGVLGEVKRVAGAENLNVTAKIDNFDKWLRKGQNSWSAADCSDLIREAGEVMEISGAHAGIKDMRPKAYFSGDTKKGEFGPRARTKDDSPAALLQRRQDMAPEVRQAVTQPLPKCMGINKFVLSKAHSAIGHMDEAFALPKGADISGTTTDSIYCLKTGAQATGRDSLAYLSALQLLPIATIVSQYHHTLLECAIPLTLHGFIGYKVGYYTTLIPKDFIGVYLPGSSIENLYHVFLEFETDSNNRHAIYKQSGAGYTEFSVTNIKESAIFKKTVADVVKNYDFFKNSEYDTGTLLKNNGLAV